MALSIKNPEADYLARQLAELTNKSLTEAIIIALREKLQRCKSEMRSRPKPLRDELLDIGQRCSRLPVLDDRTPEEILGYNENGLPG